MPFLFEVRLSQAKRKRADRSRRLMLQQSRLPLTSAFAAGIEVTTWEEAHDLFTFTVYPLLFFSHNERHDFFPSLVELVISLDVG